MDEETVEKENTEDTEEIPEEDAQEEPEEKPGFFSRLVAGLSKTRDAIAAGVDDVFFGFSDITEDFYDELEDVLISGDLGIETTEEIMDDLRREVDYRYITDPAECRQLLIDDLKKRMKMPEDAYRFEEQPSVVMMIGVNGAGKTTTLGKLAGKYKDNGKKVIVAAADTFRAAATEQLKEWADKSQAEFIGAQEGADPAAVIYDAVAAARSRHADILLCDTAGRLQNKKNLMEELKKMSRVIDREYPDACRENLIVLDATTGQNALVQAEEFGQAVPLTGVVLTKMDGTAKGGIAIAIQSELGIPVKYIGVGESMDDLQKFDADSFVNALFSIA